MVGNSVLCLSLLSLTGLGGLGLKFWVATAFC